MSEIAVLHSAPRLGDLLIHLNIYYSISRNKKQKIILICNNPSPLLKKCNFIKEIIEYKIDKNIKFINSFFKFYQISKKYNITDIFVLEKNSNPVIFAYFSGIKNIYSYGIKKIQRKLIKNKSLDKCELKNIEYDQATSFLSKLDFPEYKFYFKKNNNISNQVFLCNIASDSLRKWPTQKLNNIIQNLTKIDPAINIYINTDINEFSIIKKKFPKNVTNTINYSILELFEIISNSTFTLSIDTAPAHISIRLGIKTFVLFSRTLPNLYSNFMIPIFDKKIKNLNKLEISKFNNDIDVDSVWNVINDHIEWRDGRAV